MVIYRSPRTGIFRVHTAKTRYTENGWGLEEQPYKIIGEDDDTYITELRQSGHGEWVGDTVVQRQYTLALGVHKSRLVGWEGHQLKLFN